MTGRLASLGALGVRDGLTVLFSAKAILDKLIYHTVHLVYALARKPGILFVWCAGDPRKLLILNEFLFEWKTAA